MGGFYQSIQVPAVGLDEVRSAVEAFRAQSANASLRAYLGEPVDGWMAIYTEFSPETDTLARSLSQQFDRLALTLASIDEDELICNFCVSGKDLGFFRIASGAHRTGRRLEPVTRRIELLAPHCDADRRGQIVALFADTRDTVFSSELLRRFCAIVGIRNATTSYDYIARGDYADDLDVPVSLEHLPSS